MKAVILAAGIGSRLRPITSKKPKCMVKVAGRPILDYQIRAYAAAGIKDITIVVGYEADTIKDYCKHIKDININIVNNCDYETTNNMYSLYLVREFVKDSDFILSNADVVFDARIAHELVNVITGDAIAADKGSYTDESMKITLGDNYLINNISKQIQESEAYGNSIDVYKFTSGSASTLFNHIIHIIEKDKNLKDWTEVAIQSLLQSGELKMSPFDICGKKWIEIDNYYDLAIGDRLFSGFDTSLERKKLFFIDLDGTIYLGDKPIHGADEFIKMLQNKNIQYYFLSNNSSKAKADYVYKLNNMGVEATEDKIILSTDGLVDYLLKNNAINTFVVGTESMKQQIRNAGILVDSDEPEYVVLGYDTELTYDKIKKAAIYLHNGADLLATHCDVVCPTPDGSIPDIGSILALIETATGKKPLKIFGKPNCEMVDAYITKHGVTSKEIVFVGDRIYTDMELANRIGSEFILVLSGESKREEIEDDKRVPDLVLNSVADLL